MTTLIQQIEASSAIDDLDEALAPLQILVGVEDGGYASHWWSGPNGKAWPKGNPLWRKITLQSYITAELNFAFFGR